MIHMKKILSLLFCLFAIVGFWFSQSNVLENRALWDVTLRYCNDPKIDWWVKYILLSWKAWQDIPICLLMNNGWERPVAIWLNFVDGTTTADEQERKACQPEDQKSMFWQYITWDDMSFIIPARGSLKTELKAKFPEWYAWLANWCITAHLLSWATTQWGMFNIFSRLGYFIDILVDWEYKLWMAVSWVFLPYDNYSNNSQLPIYDNVIKDTIESIFEISNTWNVPAEIAVTSTSIWWWGIEKHQNSFTWSVLPQQNRKIEDYLWKWWYKYIGWPVTYTLDLTVTPQEIGPVLPLDWKAASYQYTANWFIIPWILIWLILVIGLWLWYKSHRKKKNENQ